MKFSLNSSDMMGFALAMLVAYAVVLAPTQVWAADGPKAIGGVLCEVVNWFQGSIGAGIATLAIIVVGVGALMGKVSWGMAIIVGLGVGIIFGAGTIVDLLAQAGGNGAEGCSGV